MIIKRSRPWDESMNNKGTKKNETQIRRCMETVYVFEGMPQYFCKRVDFSVKLSNSTDLCL